MGSKRERERGGWRVTDIYIYIYIERERATREADRENAKNCYHGLLHKIFQSKLFLS